MSEEQYNEVIKYRGILEMFHKCREYIGGADGLMNYYGMKDQRCQGCVGSFLIDRYNDMIRYEEANN